MPKRLYYSVRTGKNPKGPTIDFPTLKQLFQDLFRTLEQDGMLQEHFGYECVDAGRVPGSLGEDINAAFRFHLRKDELWPVEKCVGNYSEDDLFDIIEFVHDHVSKGVDGYYHSFSQCGHHYSTFDKDAGQTLYRNKVNELIENYGPGYELSVDGEVLELAQPGTENLLKADVPSKDSNVSSRIQDAITKFRRHRSTLAERRDAVRDLADVLEYLRPKLKSVLTKSDDSDLFNIANNFGIRHHNDKQKQNYNQSVWLSWMFYFYLATIHAALRLIEQQPTKSPQN
jgi:hypothetical protein